MLFKNSLDYYPEWFIYVCVKIVLVLVDYLTQLLDLLDL